MITHQAPPLTGRGATQKNMQYETVSSLAMVGSGAGKILVSCEPVAIQKGDNYIGYGFAGPNVFTWSSDKAHCARKVIGRSKGLVWGRTGNNTLNALPIVDI